MNEFNQIRDYFLVNTRKIDDEIRPKNVPLDEAEISQLDLDCVYHLHIGNNQTRLKHNDCFTDSFECKMSLYVGARNDDQENYDKGYSKAMCIRNELVKASNIADNEYINYVEPVRVQPGHANGNEKAFIFEIIVNVSVTYGV